MEKIKITRKQYPSDLTDAQWHEIEPLFTNMRNRKWSKRELTNAVLYINKTGCQWRNLPHDFPPYQTVFSFYSRAIKSGLWDRILQHMVRKTRTDAGKDPNPTYALIDSQSVKEACKIYKTIRAFCADAGYRGTFVKEVKNRLNLDVDISEKIKPHQWEKMPWRWIVERTFAWMNSSRRLSKEFEISTISEEAMIKISNMAILLHRL